MPNTKTTQTKPKYTLMIKPYDQAITKKYKKHSTYHEGDSGLDLFVPEDLEIKRGQTKFLDLKIQCMMINNETKKQTSYYLYPRSSISRTPLRLANSVGIIDAGYRGSIKAALTHNVTFDDIREPCEKYICKENDRYVQICAPTLEPLDFCLVDELPESTRGSKGFGSTNQ
jgi:dUTP pyrophosphatase